MGDRSVEAAGGAVPYFEIDALEGRRDRRFMRCAILAAALAHAALLLLRLPQVREALSEEPPPEIFQVKPVRFTPPSPPPQPELVAPAARGIPVPDPTPHDVEPLVVEPIGPVPDIAPPEPVFALPTPPEPAEPEAEGPVYLVGDMTPPVRIYAPPPHYTEIARRVRLEGVVIVQAIVDREGYITDVEVLKGLPMGLDQAAVEAIRKWRFEPARLADGRTVEVYFTLTVRFELQ